MEKPRNQSYIVIKHPSPAVSASASAHPTPHRPGAINLHSAGPSLNPNPQEQLWHGGCRGLPQEEGIQKYKHEPPNVLQKWRSLEALSGFRGRQSVSGLMPSKKLLQFTPHCDPPLGAVSWLIYSRALCSPVKHSIPTHRTRACLKKKKSVAATKLLKGSALTTGTILSTCHILALWRLTVTSWETCCYYTIIKIRKLRSRREKEEVKQFACLTCGDAGIGTQASAQTLSS